MITSLVYLYFSVRQIIWLWPFGILSSALFILIFFNSKFYADMGLQVYYLGISIYGWMYWSRGGMDRDQRSNLPVRRANRLDREDDGIAPVKTASRPLPHVHHTPNAPHHEHGCWHEPSLRAHADLLLQSKG